MKMIKILSIPTLLILAALSTTQASELTNATVTHDCKAEGQAEKLKVLYFFEGEKGKTTSANVYYQGKWLSLPLTSEDETSQTFSAGKWSWSTTPVSRDNFEGVNGNILSEGDSLKMKYCNYSSFSALLN